MPQFDETFLCERRAMAVAERWRFSYSYTVNPQTDDSDNNNNNISSNSSDNPSTTNNNNNNTTTTTASNNNKLNTLHNMKSHRRRNYKKLPRLSLNLGMGLGLVSPATTTTTTIASSLCPQSAAPHLLCYSISCPTHASTIVENVARYNGNGSISSPSTPAGCSSPSAAGAGAGAANTTNTTAICSRSNGTGNSGVVVYPPSNCATAASSSTSTTSASSLALSSASQQGGGGGGGATAAGSVPPAPPSAGSGATGSSGHKNSLKGTKLARRARSFKDDLIEKISLMRATNNTLGRSHSPHSPRGKHAKPPPTTEEVQKSTQTLETHVKDISNALKHFRDVILKKKLEVLPGNGTVILETIASMYSVIQSYTLNENSAMMSSATQQVYQSLGKLIKLCDEVMLTEESGECASLSNDNVREVIDLLEDAVRNLVSLAQTKLKDQQDQCAFRYSGGGGVGIGGSTGGLGSLGLSAAVNIIGSVTATTGGSGICCGRAPLEAIAQRTSLPDIALTPKERDILEQSNANPMRGSHSTESILRDTSPPPKPPLPNRSSNPPPLPPKRRQAASQGTSSSIPQSGSPHPHASYNISINSDLDCSSSFSLMNYGVDRLSVRSRSPDENSSQCSFDSALNHSREEQPPLLPLQPPPPLSHHHLLIDDNDNDIDRDKDRDPDRVINYKNTQSAAAEGEGTVAAITTTTTTPTTTSAAAPPPPTSSHASVPAPTLAPAPTIESSSSSTISVGGGGGGGGQEMTTTIGANGTELRMAAMTELNSNRHSNESGFVSMKSFRTSTQSVSKRSSDYSVQSSTKSSSSNSEIAFSSSELQQNYQCSSNSSCSNSSNRIITNHTTTNTSTNTSTSTTTTSTSYSEQAEHAVQHLHGSISPDLSHVKLPLGGGIGCSTSNMESAPALPPKTRCSATTTTHTTSTTTHLVDDVDEGEIAELRQLPTVHQWQAKHHSLIEPTRSIHQLGSSGEEKPPLPMKKKNILVYMEICTPSTRSIEQHRHTMHSYNRNMSHSQTLSIIPSLSKDLSPENEIPPALPPKNYNKRRQPAVDPSQSQSQPSPLVTSTYPPAVITTPPPSPKPTSSSAHHLQEEGSSRQQQLAMNTAAGNGRMTTVSEELTDDDNVTICHSHELPTETTATTTHTHTQCNFDDEDDAHIGGNADGIKKNVQNNKQEIRQDGDVDVDDNDVDVDVDVDVDDDDDDDEDDDNQNVEQLPNMLEEIDITPYLIFKKTEEDGPEVKGGYIDALIVHASRVQKVADNAFSEAFITTFRTFIQPIDVIEKLTHRYTYFFCQVHDQKQKAAKETFSLLVRVVNDLTSSDLTSQLLSLLVEFVYQLVCSGQLYLAKLLRNKFVEKVTIYKIQKMYGVGGMDGVGVGAGIGVGVGGGMRDMLVSSNHPSLLDLKSLEIAEQMTLLDAELFQKIEIPEVLLFAKDQCEEKSPNLNKFTEHFNKMSYWARSKILLLQDAKEREKHVNKFIKIMKHLRKMNNYNSYLALLSALDSGPVRRLEWQKSTVEEIGSFCALIDSSSSFRAYRQALAETNPPCIPYIGLVLQDLTFVHVGNQDYLSKGVINFSKRWQQYNIIVNMKRFKKCAYPFRRNERIIRFFENFKDFLGEEEMWQISEKIKPRGRRPNNY